MGGHFLDIGAVGELSGGVQGSLVQAVEGENFLGVLPYGNVAVSDGQQYLAVFQQLRQFIEAPHAFRIALGNGQSHLVFQQVETGV